MIHEGGDGGIVLRLPAVLDIFSVGPMRVCIHELLENGHRRLRLDMADVEVIEAEGLGMLGDALARARELDAEIDFIQPSTGIAEVLDLAGMEKRASVKPAGRQHSSRQGRER